MSNDNNYRTSTIPHYNDSIKLPTRGILQQTHDYEAHITPEHKLKWDENKLKATEKQKEQVSMKVDEPNTPYIRYNPLTDQVTNWEALPESVQKAANQELEEFSLDNDNSDMNHEEKRSISVNTNKDEWEKADEKEEKAKEELARKHHEEFERKRAKHYYHNGDVMLHDKC